MFQYIYVIRARKQRNSTGTQGGTHLIIKSERARISAICRYKSIHWSFGVGELTIKNSIATEPSTVFLVYANIKKWIM